MFNTNKGQLPTQSATPGKPVIVVVQEGDSLIAKAAAASSGTVQRIGSNGSILQTWNVAANGSISTGAFAGAQQFLITCTAGSVSAEVEDVAITIPQIIVSSAAPNNADGRPDGTIYIQTA